MRKIIAGAMPLLVVGVMILIVPMFLERAASAPPNPTPAAVETVKGPALSEKVSKALTLTNPKLTAGQINVFVTLLVSVADEIFDNEDDKLYWVALLAVESGFNQATKSKVGAVGLGQLMPEFVGDFGKTCGFTELPKSAVNDTYTNALLSACYFRSLIQHHGSIPLAIASYNCGQNSEDLKRLRAGVSINSETANHVAKTIVKKEQIED